MSRQIEIVLTSAVLAAIFGFLVFDSVRRYRRNGWIALWWPQSVQVMLLFRRYYPAQLDNPPPRAMRWIRGASWLGLAIAILGLIGTIAADFTTPADDVHLTSILELGAACFLGGLTVFAIIKMYLWLYVSDEAKKHRVANDE